MYDLLSMWGIRHVRQMAVSSSPALGIWQSGRRCELESYPRGSRVSGEPTYRHIAYLGSIAESAIEIPAQRRFFWARVLEQLDKLGSGVSSHDRQRMIASVARKVAGPPTQAECEHLDRDLSGAWWLRRQTDITRRCHGPRQCFISSRSCL